MMIKVAVSDCFKLKMIPSFRSVFFPEKQEIHYIGGTDIHLAVKKKVMPFPFSEAGRMKKEKSFLLNITGVWLYI